MRGFPTARRPSAGPLVPGPPIVADGSVWVPNHPPRSRAFYGADSCVVAGGSVPSARRRARVIRPTPRPGTGARPRHLAPAAGRSDPPPPAAVREYPPARTVHGAIGKPWARAWTREKQSGGTDDTASFLDNRRPRAGGRRGSGRRPAAAVRRDRRRPGGVGRGGVPVRRDLAEAAARQLDARQRGRGRGGRPRPHLDRAPPRQPHPAGARRRRGPAAGRVLPLRPAGHRVRPGRQRGERVGRARRGLRVARLGARHLHRPPRQRLARRQRRRRRPHPEVHPRRRVPAADRPARPGRGQQRLGELRPAGRDRRRPRDQRGVHRRRLRQPPGRGLRRRHRRVQAPLGRLRQPAHRRALQLRPRRAALAAVRAARCTARPCPTTASSTCATG